MNVTTRPDLTATPPRLPRFYEELTGDPRSKTSTPHTLAERVSATHVIDISNDLVQPSCKDRTVACSKNILYIGGELALAGTTIYLGATTGLSSLTIATLVGSVALLSLKAIDSLCGNGSRTAEIFQNGLKEQEVQLRQEQGIIAKVTTEVNATKALEVQDQTAINAVTAINQAGAADAVRFEQNVSNLQQEISSLAPNQGQSQDELKASTEQNILLQQRIDNYVSLFNQIHAQVQKASEMVPELQKIDLTWNTATHSFEQNSSKIIEGFNQVLKQMNGHADLNQTLSNTIAGLQAELKFMQTLVTQKESTYKDIESENKRLNELVSQQTISIKNLKENWDEGKNSLEERKHLLLEEKAQFEALSNSVNIAIQVSSSSSISSQLQELIRAHKALVEDQKKNLEDK